MNLRTLSIKKAINSFFLKSPVSRAELVLLRSQIKHLLSQRNENESEEYNKNLIRDFLKNVWYSNVNVNTHGRKDLVIYNGNEKDSNPAVIIEVKSPSNISEMPSDKNMNTKAFQELVWYFMEEYVGRKNHEIKRLVITNLDVWYIFKADDFANYFAKKDKELISYYNKFKQGITTRSNTESFYLDGAKPAIERFLSMDYDVVKLNINEYKNDILSESSESDKKIKTLYKLFAPETLLDKPFGNDSNSLNKHFYSELLYIIGLEEVKRDGVLVIDRLDENKRMNASLIESTLYKLEDKKHIKSEDERFELALRLCITWINRILFLKLLEAQIFAYHNKNKDMRFLHVDMIPNYDELDRLFFKVLAKRPEERDELVKHKYKHVPYLNSSLFEISPEEEYLQIGGIQDSEMDVMTSTVLRRNGKKKSGKIRTIEYLFSFLSAYNFASEFNDEIQEDQKQLINSSVLGLIFEKLLPST